MIRELASWIDACCVAAVFSMVGSSQNPRAYVAKFSLSGARRDSNRPITCGCCRSGEFSIDLVSPLPTGVRACSALGRGIVSHFTGIIMKERLDLLHLRPTEFRFSITGPPGLFAFTVSLQGQTLIETRKDANGGPDRIRTNPQTLGEWRAFRNKMDSRGIDVWSWKDSYGTPGDGGLYGITWELKLIHSDKSICSVGHGRFPLAGGGSSREPGNRFMRFVSAVNIVTNRLDARNLKTALKQSPESSVRRVGG